MAENIREMILLCQELPLFQQRLHRAGLHKTAQKMKAAVDEIGFEVESHLSKDESNA